MPNDNILFYNYIGYSDERDNGWMTKKEFQKSIFHKIGANLG